MGISQNWKIQVINDRLMGSIDRDIAVGGVPTQHLKDFKIEEVGCMKGFTWHGKPGQDGRRGRSSQKHFEDRRCIQNDHCLSRSLRTAASGESVGAAPGLRPVR